MFEATTPFKLIFVAPKNGGHSDSDFWCSKSSDTITYIFPFWQSSTIFLNLSWHTIWNAICKCRTVEEALPSAARWHFGKIYDHSADCWGRTNRFCCCRCYLNFEFPFVFLVAFVQSIAVVSASKLLWWWWSHCAYGVKQYLYGVL